MDDSEKIERVLQVMRELKSLEKRIREFEADFPETMAYMLALISTAPVPNVTILTSKKEMAEA